MSWKDWPSWLKGGVIALCISLFFCVLFFTILYMDNKNGGNEYSGIPAFIIAFPFSSQFMFLDIYIWSFLIPSTLKNSLTIKIIYFIFISLLILIIDFFIGAVIGSKVGKGKNKELENLAKNEGERDVGRI